MSPALFLGVDGGGTGCRARVEDSEGRILGQGFSGPATLRLGVEGAWASVIKAADAAIAEAGLTAGEIACITVGVALAGIGRKGALDSLKQQPHPFASIAFTNDAHVACLGAHSGRDGAIVIAGTGSIGLGFVGDRQLRVGGYGFPVSDEGSGAYLGLTALQMALRAQDGRIPTSSLLTEIMQRFDNDPAEVVAWMDRAAASEYATMAPAVLRHADQGDAAARQIVQSAATHLDTLIRALFSQGAPRVSLLGGLASVIEPWLAPDLRRRLRPADGDAVSGAIVLAKRGIN
jgi:glucosamine kinase